MQDFDTRYAQPGGGFVTGLLFGAAVGAALGIIFAPRAGADTRRQLAESGKNLRENAMKTYDQARDGANAAVSKARDAYDRGREAFDRTRRDVEDTDRARPPTGVGRAVERRRSARYLDGRAGRGRRRDSTTPDATSRWRRRVR